MSGSRLGNSSQHCTRSDLRMSEMQDIFMGGGGGACPQIPLVVTVYRPDSHTCALAAFTSRGYYSRAAFISFKSFADCVATIRRNTVVAM